MRPSLHVVVVAVAAAAVAAAAAAVVVVVLAVAVEMLAAVELDEASSPSASDELREF